MKWWNDLWLNESFATFMSYKVVGNIHHDWDPTGDQILLRTEGALRSDSLTNTHPIDADVRNPDEVAQIFDEISYGKGASILRMIENYVGEEKFRDGIRIYLKRYQYGNAMGSDLWSCIEEASGMPISRIMEAWIKRKGYPLILAESVNGKLKLRQKRFMLNGEDSESLWPVPLFVKRRKGNERLLFETREIEIEDNGVLKLNDSQIGFYRVMYSDELWKRISSSFSGLTRLDFRELLSDLFAFLKSGNIVLEEYMRRLEPFMGLDDYVVVEDLAGQLFTLASILPDNEKLNSMAVSYFRKHLESLGEKRKGEADYISILRSNLSVYLASTDLEYDRRLAADFHKLFDIDPDLRAAVAIAEARINNNFNSLIDKYRIASGDEDRIKILSGIGWLSGKENNQRTIQMIDENTIKKQDILRVYTGMSANPANRAKVFEEIPRAMEIMEKNFRGTAYPGMMAEMIIPVVGLGREAEMKKLAKSIKKPSNQNGVNKGIETLDIYSRLVKNSKR
jgi:tricorn protease interacting factor F2/3